MQQCAGVWQAVRFHGAIIILWSIPGVCSRARGVRASSVLYATHHPSTILQRKMSQALSSAAPESGAGPPMLLKGQPSAVLQGALIQVMKSKRHGWAADAAGQPSAPCTAPKALLNPVFVS